MRLGYFRIGDAWLPITGPIGKRPAFKVRGQQ